MQSEIIYASSVRVLILEKSPPFFKANILGKAIEIKETDKLGGIFPITIYQNLKDANSAKKKLEMMFQNLQKTNPLGGSLEYHLKRGNVIFTLARKEEGKPQYLGLTYESPINLEPYSKKTIIPCQFYLIKDDLRLETYFRTIFPISESSPTHSPISDWTSQRSTSKIYHPQEFSPLLL